jgi:tetratricopeptide (TPR) repeat protein
MANELISGGYYTTSAALGLQGMTYRQFMERQTQEVNTAIRDAADRQAQAISAQAQAISAQTQADRENAAAIVASNAVLARVNEQGFEEQHNDALMMNNTLRTGFSGLSDQLGTMTAAFNAGFEQLHGAIKRMSADICEHLDAIHDIVKNPLRTQARELYTRAADRYARGLFEESLKDVKAAVEKDETDYLSWFLMGHLYLFGAGEFSNVVDIDRAIDVLTNAAKYISPDAMTQAARAKKIYRDLEPHSGEGLVKEIMQIGGITYENAARDMRDACGQNPETISRRLAGLNIPDRLASEVYFYLGLARYYKSNDLTLGKAEGEAKSFLESALKAFNRSLEYSGGMLESRYNSARCRTLLGDAESALKDLEAAIKGDRNYALKVLADSDFDSIGKDVAALIGRVKNETYLKAKDDLETLRARLAGTIFLEGTFSEMIQKMAAEWIPQTIEADLPYFDLLDIDGRLQIMLTYLHMEYYPCDRLVAELNTAELENRGAYILQDMFLEKLYNESIVLKRSEYKKEDYYQLLGYQYIGIMEPGKITLTNVDGSNPPGIDSGKYHAAGRIQLLFEGGLPEKRIVTAMPQSSFSATSPVWRFAFSFDKSKDSEHQGFGFYHVNDKNFFFQVDLARNTAGDGGRDVWFENRVAAFLNKETLMILSCSGTHYNVIENIKVFQPGIISRSEFEAFEQRKRQIATEEARRRAEEAQRVEEERRRVEEERHRAEEEQAARDAAERTRYKRRRSVWLVFRIIFAIAFVLFGVKVFNTYFPLVVNGGSESVKYVFILLALSGCAFGGVFSSGGFLAGPVMGVIMGIADIIEGGSSVGNRILGVIVVVIAGGLAGLIAGSIASAFYRRLKKMLKAELKLEPRAAPYAGVIPAPQSGTVLRFTVAKGARVASGSTIIVINSSYMELAVQSPFAGKVHFLVKKGTWVAAQQPVAEVL